MHSFPWRILLLILLVAILIASAGTWFYQEQAHYMLRRTQRDLEAIANLKVEEIEQWRGRRLADADLLVDSPIFIQTVKDWMESPSASLPEGPATRLRNFQKYYHYRDALLVRTDGQIRWSLEGRTGALTSAEQDALEQSVRRREPVLTEISFAESGTEHMAVVAPFFLPDRDMGAPVGAALLDIDPQTFLFPYLASWPTPSRSAETILVRQEGDAALIISQARHLPETPQRFRYPLTQIDSPVVQAVLGTRGVVEGRDYRGVEVLAVLSAVPNSVWFVVTKMDKAEALEAWRFRSVTIILIMLGCFTTASGALLVAWQRHEKVHYRNLFQAEAARRESEERLRYALAASETGVWEINLDDLTAQVTEVTDHIVGYTGPVSAERNVGTFLARIVPEDRPAAEREIQRAIREKNDTGLECRIIREDGARRWIRARGRIRDMGPGKGRHLMGIIQDITDQKAVEAQLREAQQFSEQIVQSAQEGVVVFDTEVRYVVWNPFMERMWGIPAAEALGKHPWELFPSVREEGTVGLLERALAGESVSALEIPWTIPPAGRQVWLDGNFGPLRSQTGEIIGAIVTLRDATQRRKAEEEKEGLRAQLLQAHKMEAVGRLAGGVAHDFNNMLGVILGHAELALEHLDSPERAGHDLQTILEAARRSTDLTGQLLAFARKQTTVPKVLDLNETVERALQMLQRLIGEDVALKWAPGPKLWRIKIDPGQIDQILANLMVNARDAIPGNGQITLETGHVTLDASYPHADAEFVPGEYVVLQVSDNGTGMDKTTLEHLFEPFYTTKDQGKGTGLGLATVYGIVKQNGGLISVYSEAGLGSTFKIYLPRCLAAAPAADRAQPEGPHCEGTETVLIVEDEMTLLTLSSRMMKQLGYTVLAAASPEEAVRCVESYAGDIDLLVTDVVMPGMNGRELCERLRQLRPALKCLYMSGYTADVIAHHGVLNEGLHFLCKPYSMKSLGEGVRAALEG